MSGHATSTERPSTASGPNVALFLDGDGAHMVIAGPKRGRPPIEVNAAIRGTAAVFDSERKVWVIPADDAPAVVANMRSRGLAVSRDVYPWTVRHDTRSPDPLPECVRCATPYRRIRPVPSFCVSCGDQLELQTVRTLERITARPSTTCPACSDPVDSASMFCGGCGGPVKHG